MDLDNMGIKVDHLDSPDPDDRKSPDLSYHDNDDDDDDVQTADAYPSNRTN